MKVKAEKILLDNQNQEQTKTTTEQTETLTDFSKLEDLKITVEPEKTERRGRPKGSKNKVNQNQDNKTLDAEIPISFSPLISLIITRLPDKTPLTQTEIKLIDETSNKVFQKYLGNNSYSEEISLSIILFSVFYPRLKKPEIKNE